MEACVRHLRLEASTTGIASLVLIQDTLDTLGHQAVCCEVAFLLPLLASLYMGDTQVPYLKLHSGVVAAATISCSNSDKICAHFSISL